MKRYWWFLAVLASSAAVGQEPAKPLAVVDITKTRVIERPTEALVAVSSPQEVPAAAATAEPKPIESDRTKRLVVEPAAEAIVRGAVPPPDASAAAEPGRADPPDNPRVEPGIVNWHDSVAEAIAAAKASRKPVLVFHLLGRLDQRFT